MCTCSVWLQEKIMASALQLQQDHKITLSQGEKERAHPCCCLIIHTHTICSYTRVHGGERLLGTVTLLFRFWSMLHVWQLCGVFSLQFLIFSNNGNINMWRRHCLLLGNLSENPDAADVARSRCDFYNTTNRSFNTVHLVKIISISFSYSCLAKVLFLCQLSWFEQDIVIVLLRAWTNWTNVVHLNWIKTVISMSP